MFRHTEWVETSSRSVLLTCCCFFLVPWAALAQPPERVPVVPTLAETIEVRVMNVEVVVTDRSGKRVRGLPASDFPNGLTNLNPY